MNTLPPANSEMVRDLGEDIVFGVFHPKERLTEEDLMARFGVKRHLVREALTQLDCHERELGLTVVTFGAQQVEDRLDRSERARRDCARLGATGKAPGPRAGGPRRRSAALRVTRIR